MAVRHKTHGLLVLSPMGSIALCPGVPSGLVGTLQACREEEGRRRAGMELPRWPLLLQTLSRSHDLPVVGAEPPGQTQLLTFLKEPWQWRWQQ